jgi:hypothetical protein
MSRRTSHQQPGICVHLTGDSPLLATRPDPWVALTLPEPSGLAIGASQVTFWFSHLIHGCCFISSCFHKVELCSFCEVFSQTFSSFSLLWIFSFEILF